MVSNRTLKKILEIMNRHLTAKQCDAILDELIEVSGNKSFRETVQAMRRDLKTK